MEDYAILLVGETETLLDRDDYERFSGFTWRLSDKGYVKRGMRDPETHDYVNVYLAREIMDCPTGLMVDHRNRNPLDNRRANLRIVTARQNAHNSGSFGGSSRFKGVSKVPGGKWKAYIYEANGKQKYLGLFPTEEEAAEVRDEAAKQMHGEYAYLNLRAA